MLAKSKINIVKCSIGWYVIIRKKEDVKLLICNILFKQLFKYELLLKNMYV